jgi:hypothetical protein
MIDKNRGYDPASAYYCTIDQVVVNKSYKFKDWKYKGISLSDPINVDDIPAIRIPAGSKIRFEGVGNGRPNGSRQFIETILLPEDADILGQRFKKLIMYILMKENPVFGRIPMVMCKLNKG